jgi:hypothetical protein
MDVQASQDAEHLKLLSIFHYIVAGLMALMACLPILHLVFGVAIVSGALDGAKSGPPPWFVGWFFVIAAAGAMLLGWTLAVCTAIAGRSLANRKRYLFCLVVAGVMAVTCMPFGTVLGVFTILVLMRPSVKMAFGALPEGGAA